MISNEIIYEVIKVTIKMEFFSDESLNVIREAHTIACNLHFSDVGTDHLLLAFCSNKEFFSQLGLDAVDIKFAVYKSTGVGNSKTQPTSYTFKVKEIIDKTVDRCPSKIEPIDLFISVLEQENSVAQFVFEDLNIDCAKVLETAKELAKNELAI